RIAVVGAGPAGLACATVAAQRGHEVVLFESADRIGGQFNLARKIPGKEEFGETLRWFRHRIGETGVQLRLSTTATPDVLPGFDEVVLATGVVPRAVDFDGHDHPRVLGYLDVQPPPSPTMDVAHWMREWGVDPAFESAGGLRPARVDPPQREVWLLQRSPGRPGARLGKTTGWIHRSTLRHKGVRMIGGVEYVAVDDEGFHVRVDGQAQVLAVDHVVVCAGQEPLRPLLAPLQAGGQRVHLVGGADVAAELDAKRAIDQACRL